MTSVIIVEKTGKAKSVQVSSADELYKKCGFKSTAGYELAHTWTVVFNDVEYKLDVYGKTKGKAGSENKYEFPPPIDNLLFFGNVAVIGRESDKYISLSVDEFNDIMEHLQGGYEELESDDTDSTDGLTEGFAKTKEGYVKDGFIASSESEDEKPNVKSEATKREATVKQAESSRMGAKSEATKSEANAKSEATGKSEATKSEANAKSEGGKSKVVKKPVKPRLKKKEEPQVAVYVEELTEDPYF
jgi:hypothetical protein